MDNFLNQNINKLTGLGVIAFFFLSIVSLNYFATNESVRANINKTKMENARTYATKEELRELKHLMIGISSKLNNICSDVSYLRGKAEANK
jgi:hypothetical protein